VVAWHGGVGVAAALELEMPLSRHNWTFMKTISVTEYLNYESGITTCFSSFFASLFQASYRSEHGY
jgi:hypothetical protein